MSQGRSEGQQEAELLRGGAALLAGGAVAILVTVPVIQPPETPNDLLAHFDEIYQLGVDLWLLSHLALIGGTLGVMLGLTLIGLTVVSGSPIMFVRIGVLMAVVGGVLLTTYGTVNGLVLGSVVEQLFNGRGNPDGLFEVALTIWWVGRGLFVMGVIVFFGLSYLAFGVAVTWDRRFADRLGYVAVASGVAMTVLGLMTVTALPVPEFERALYPVVLVVSLVWTIGLALQAWQHANAIHPSSTWW